MVLWRTLRDRQREGAAHLSDRRVVEVALDLQPEFRVSVDLARLYRLYSALTSPHRSRTDYLSTEMAARADIKRLWRQAIVSVLVGGPSCEYKS